MFVEFLSQNLVWVIAFVVVFNLLVFTTISANVKGANHVSALQLPQLQRDGKSVIIDVNEPADYQKEHIPDAKNYPVSTLNADNSDLLKHKDKTVIISCQTGSRSTKAAKTLLGLGFSNIHILTGGLASWTKENLPVSKG